MGISFSNIGTVGREQLITSGGNGEQNSGEAVHRIGGGGQGARAQGALVQPLQAVLQPGDIPLEHVGVGHHVVSKGGGLGPLKVGITRHDGV